MYRLIFTTLLGLALLFGAAPFASAAPLIVGHRGATTVSGIREGSLDAYKYAARKRVVLEGDVRWTKDNRMVILHDSTLNRTTNCSGSVESKTYTSLRKCANSNVVPTLANVLKIARDNHVSVNLELKAPPAGYTMTNGDAHEFAERIREYGMTNRAVISCFCTSRINLVKKQPDAPGLRYALLTKTAVDSKTALGVGSIYMPKFTALTPAKTAEYHAAGLQVWAWTANTVPDYNAIEKSGADAIVANNPGTAVSWAKTQ